MLRHICKKYDHIKRINNIRGAASAKPKPDLEKIRKIEDEFKEGSELEGFLVNKVTAVPEFGMTMVRLRHVRTGCDYLHLARDDSNNVFSIGFRTTPLNSYGIPHILEHVVLCGSLKYPCKDPFFRMMGRSMANFMNAMTGPDYTLYPFATQNKSDFKNLMSIYMDAVFKPQLRELDFLQEGWRYEHENLNDRESPLAIKGIVYNEMKGVFADKNAVFSNAVLNNLLPSHTYGVISGGDPKLIPNLNFADVKAFHKKYYHPSNCRIYSYGTFPLIDSLSFINKEYLADYPDTSDYTKSTKVPNEPKWETERRKHLSCSPNTLAVNPKKQSTIAITSLCNDIKAVQETFNMQVISELLVSTGYNAAFYKSFIEPGIGAGFAPVSGYDSQTRDTFFSVGLCGLDSNDFDRVIEIYHKTLDDVIEHGFEESNINAILHTIELLTKHQTSNFGLNMLFQITPVWNHDGDISRSILINSKVMKFRKTLAENPTFLQDTVQECLKNNAHRLILTMSPDEDFISKENQKEKEMLEQRVGELTPAVRDGVHEQCLQLQREREMRPDIRCLPSLTIADLAPDLERVDLKGYTVQGVPIQVCNVPTNGISYIRGVLNTSILSEDAKSLLPLFCTAATKMGTKSRNYKQMDQLVQLKTGRLSFGTHIAENIYDILSYEEGITFSSMCIDKNVKAMMGLWTDIFTQVNFNDVKRFRTVVKEAAESLIQDLSASGDLYAVSVASARISPPAERKEQLGGLRFIRKMEELSNKTNLSETLEMMSGISQVILKKRLIRVAINTSVENEEKFLMGVDGFLKAVPGEFKKSYEITKTNLDDQPVNINMHVEMPGEVNFTAHCMRTVAYTHVDFPILRLAARLLTTKYCLPNIREKGGAYGASANISTSGVLSLSSYRDPKPASSFETFKKAKAWLESGLEYSDGDVEEAKLGVFQSIDSPVPAGSKGVRNFLFGISDDELQRHRKSIMGAKKEDIMRVAQFIDEHHQARCLIGPNNLEVTSRNDEEWKLCYAD
ncbi:hypothetical protein GE061_006304 [Apolygus lucorum]|uniref:Presequence protease, mitochondrial n=1 Tax=Apolygus lucorum TaxID=248454 RepID=A0A6A4JBR4_APOLU|nr:hypothetical protein GE061_006304 [Apolygus lucorum]